MRSASWVTGRSPRWTVKLRRGPTLAATIVDTTFVVATSLTLLTSTVGAPAAQGTLAQDADFRAVTEKVGRDGLAVLFYGSGSKSVLNDGKTGFTLGGPAALLVDFPSGLAKARKVKKVTAVVIDVPAATDFYKDGTGPFKDAGIDLKLVPVPPGTADMTPQMQQVVSNNPDGIVTVVGNDPFCIAAFNGLRTAGFEGTVAAIPQCITEATKKAVPADFLSSIQIGATTPFPNTDDPSVKQYLAVLDEYGTPDIDRGDTNGATTFSTVAALGVATADLTGEVTPASVAAAIHSMKESVIPGTGGLKFRCNGKADPTGGPGICSRGLLAATLDSSGTPSNFKKLNDDPIPD